MVRGKVGMGGWGMGWVDDHFGIFWISKMREDQVDQGSAEPGKMIESDRGNHRFPTKIRSRSWNQFRERFEGLFWMGGKL